VPVDHEIAGLLELLATVDKPLHRMTPPQAREAFAGLVVGSRRPEHVIVFDMVPLSGAAREAVEETCRLFGEVLHP
jgi:hypothetical protein